jgi:hypothetical protein
MVEILSVHVDFSPVPLSFRRSLFQLRTFESALPLAKSISYGNSRTKPDVT